MISQRKQHLDIQSAVRKRWQKHVSALRPQHLQSRRATLYHEGIQAGQGLSGWTLATDLCGTQAQTEPEGAAQKAAICAVFGNNLVEHNRCSS